MRSAFIIAIVSAVAGFLAGNLSQPQQQQTELSSTYNGDKDTALLYDCPPQAEFKLLTQAINFKGTFSHSCTDIKMSKLGRVLKFISQAKANYPAKWTAMRDVLDNPLKYVQRNARSTQVDLSQRTTIAQNSNRGDINLGGRFFTNDTLDSALSLLHEARHSEPLDPAHTTCRWGDVAGATGGCDLKFSTDQNAGAYAYQVLIGVAWAKYLPNLTQGQREYLLSIALIRLAGRFNIVPPALAVPVEQLWALDEDGKVFLVSPITGQLQATALPATMSYRRIEFYDANNGLLGLTGSAAYIHRASGAPQDGYFNFRKLDVESIKDVASMSNRNGESQDPFEYMITTDNILKFIDTNVSTGERFVNESPHQPKNFGFTLNRLVHARRKRYALTDERTVVMLDDDAVKITESSFSHPTGFKQLQGGLFYSALFGVTSEGRIKYWNDSKKDSVESMSQFSQPVKKLIYSVSFIGALFADNQIEIKLLGVKPKLLKLSHPKRIVDIAVTRSYQLNYEKFGSTELSSTLQQATNACALKIAQPGVWSSDIVGINNNNQVVTYSVQTKKCAFADLRRHGIKNQGITSIELTGTAYGSTTNLSFPMVSFKKTDGTSQSFVPYNFQQ